MIGIFIIIFVILLSLLIIFQVNYNVETYNKASSIKIPFSLFKQMYLITPSKWEINGAFKNNPIYKGTNFYFGYLGYLKFLLFKKKLKKEIKLKQMSDILKDFQKDINDFKYYY